MDAKDPITAAQFLAFLKCPTKAHLLGISEPPPDPFFTNIETQISSMHKVAARLRLRVGAKVAETEPLDFGQLWRRPYVETITRYVDCETAVYDLALPSHRSKARQSLQPTRHGSFTPILFSAWDKPEVTDNLRLCFGALALSQSTGILADTGALIYGDGPRHRTVKIANHVARVRQIIEAIGAIRHAIEPPPLILNRHCAVCDFQPRCRGLAIERDDLSLLSAITEKERAKYNARGISTVTHLSYGYRPRRRKRTRPDAERSAKSVKRAARVERNDHKLKALAVKKSQIHVVGTPSLKFEGVPTFLDVEGMPDRDFYYLVGLRYESIGGQVERSFWADELDDERVMWENCLRTLKAIGNAQIVAYGAYENRFLRRMRARYIQRPDDAEFVDRLIKTSVNLVNCIYGRVYFPTFSNSLKEVGRYLGLKWTWRQASGAAAPLLRRAWELGADDGLKRELIDYNMDDCRAAATVTDALVRICDADASGLDAVDVGSLEVGFQHTFGKFDSALPEFAKINNAAYWDYQRSKVYARTDKIVRRTVQKSSEKGKTVLVEKEIAIGGIPTVCSKCGASGLQVRREGSYVVFDLKFMRNGIKRWVIRYRYGRYRCPCPQCGAEMTTYSARPMYGPNLRAFVVYLMIELRLSNQKVAEHLSLLFNLPLKATQAYHMKSAMAEKYAPTYQGILHQIANGKLVHADETTGVIRGGGHYMWVFANLTTVAYVYSESRESTILEDVLDGFSGVLVSDFYAAYDSVPCPQQKCLIHLMRDINDDLHKNPFDDELKEVAGRFGTLLREIVDTIDTYGLKARHLAKHRKSSSRFIENVVAMKCATDAALALKRRIEKNKDKLFTFLDYDGVPWNNNNAEHAVRAFTRIRNMMTTSTPKGHREYATLLSIQQTLRYRGMSFLEFIRSGKMEIDG
jgi:predicted RecB family nuclease